MHCVSGNEICGGPQRLTLLIAANAGSSTSSATPSATVSSTQSSTPSSTSDSAPTSTSTTTPSAGWSSLGCRQDNVSGRTLNVDAFTSDAMTIDACIAHCDALGQPLAGLEYARECYCGNSFKSQGGALIADEACNMPCSGDGARLCGGPDALTVFKKTQEDGRRGAEGAQGARVWEGARACGHLLSPVRVRVRPRNYPSPLTAARSPAV